MDTIQVIQAALQNVAEQHQRGINFGVASLLNKLDLTTAYGRAQERDIRLAFPMNTVPAEAELVQNPIGDYPVFASSLDEVPGLSPSDLLNAAAARSSMA